GSSRTGKLAGGKAREAELRGPSARVTFTTPAPERWEPVIDKGTGGGSGDPKVARKGIWVLAPTNEKHKFRLKTKEIVLELPRGPWKVGDDPRGADVPYLLEALDAS